MNDSWMKRSTILPFVPDVVCHTNEPIETWEYVDPFETGSMGIPHESPGRGDPDETDVLDPYETRTHDPYETRNHIDPHEAGSPMNPYENVAVSS